MYVGFLEGLHERPDTTPTARPGPCAASFAVAPKTRQASTAEDAGQGSLAAGTSGGLRRAVSTDRPRTGATRQPTVAFVKGSGARAPAFAMPRQPGRSAGWTSAKGMCSFIHETRLTTPAACRRSEGEKPAHKPPASSVFKIQVSGSAFKICDAANYGLEEQLSERLSERHKITRAKRCPLVMLLAQFLCSLVLLH
jgi:hypothetical protein